MSETKTYLLRKHGEVLKVEVPAEWKVTYGPIQPGGRSEFGGRGNYVRFYESDKQQRAVFADVLELLDSSIPIKRMTQVIDSNSSMKKSSNKIEHEDSTEYNWEEVPTEF